MLKVKISILFIVIATISCAVKKDKGSLNNNYALVIHGGAGNIVKKNFTQAKENEYRTTLNEALSKGIEKLKQGESAVKVVELVIKQLENSPLFNAGKGSVYSNNGKQMMDASIMDGKDLSCGSVAGVTNIKNPISAARVVKDETPHVFLYGEECQDFCVKYGIELEDASYFKTSRSWKQYQRALKKDNLLLDHDQGSINEYNESKKYGTVGCVVLDKQGNIAAGTSTGGLTNKKHGRIGDSPVIGAGTYADNASCAVSCTGVGEFFIRGTVARDISAQMEFGKKKLDEAGKLSMEKLEKLGGKGGFIAIDKNGNYTMMYNTKGMYRGYANSKGEITVSLF